MNDDIANDVVYYILVIGICAVVFSIVPANYFFN